jgi:hypothetical protein
VTRTLLTGGLVFDGTGAPPAQADVLIEGGRIIEVGPGLDGDEAVDVAGRHLLPGGVPIPDASRRKAVAERRGPRRLLPAGRGRRGRVAMGTDSGVTPTGATWPSSS